MKLLRTLFATTMSVLGIVTILGGVVFAAPASQNTINHSVYKAGQDVTINGTINGDIFCAGQTVTIDATVNGDVLCAAQSLDINGRVNGNIRATGQTVTVHADVTKSVSIMGQSVTIASGAHIGDDLSLFTNTSVVNGTVGRDISSSSVSLTLNSTVGRNVHAYVSNLHLLRAARIDGNLTYTSPNKASRESGSYVAGKVTYHGSTQQMHMVYHVSWLAYFGWALFLLISLLVLTLILVAVMPRVFGLWTDEVVRPHVWAPLLTGFVASFVVPAIAFAFLFTVIGWPFTLLLLLSWGVASIVALPLVAYSIGWLMLHRVAKARLLYALVGSLVLGVICLIPFVGFFIWILAYWLGLGEFIMGLYHARKNGQSPQQQI